jgi:murein DD-endopeptidase MepM/ murein hydrolase activator NlpD
VLSGCNVPPDPSAIGTRPGRVTVAAGQTVQDVARDAGVSMTALIVANNLQSPYRVQPGQTLVLPSGGAVLAEAPAAPTAVVPVRPASPVPTPIVGPAAGTAPAAPFTGQPAGAASAFASRPLPPPNGAGVVAPGAVAPAAAAPGAAIPGAPTPIVPQGAVAAVPPAAFTPTGPRRQPPPPPIPAAPAPALAAPAPAAAAVAGGKLAWPLAGSVLVGYGGEIGGKRNEGINIGASGGTPVRAAAGGTVIYAGNEVRGYGNLVLIRHDNNLVTAYAHLGSMTVSRDQPVSAGQDIGTVGQTGAVTQPQLHFEVREGRTPVDPTKYLPS